MDRAVPIIECTADPDARPDTVIACGLSRWASARQSNPTQSRCLALESPQQSASLLPPVTMRGRYGRRPGSTPLARGHFVAPVLAITPSSRPPHRLRRRVVDAFAATPI